MDGFFEIVVVPVAICIVVLLIVAVTGRSANRPRHIPVEEQKLMGITAEQARGVTLKYLLSASVESYVAILDEEIEREARLGFYAINPWDFIQKQRRKGAELTAEKRGEIRRHYESRGFTWVEHPSPDSEHPRSQPYTILAW
jgi:hypothetical protein